MYTLQVFKRDSDNIPINIVKGFKTEIEAETHFWEKEKPYLDDFASFIIIDSALLNCYPETTVPRFAVIVFNVDDHAPNFGAILNRGMFVDTAWFNGESIWDISARSFEWYDLETKRIYRGDKSNMMPMSQEEWDNLPSEQQYELLSMFNKF